MNKKGILSIVCILLAATAACSAGPANPSAAATNTPRPSRTPTGVPTLTATATEIPTVEPVVTASPGPAPDLELLNVTFAEGPSGTIFMGEMRNNTAEAMIFPGREDALHLRLEKWVGGGYYPYYHHQYDVYLKPEIQADRMNCLLYPGETGVAMFSISLECSDRNICKVESEELSGPPPQLGMRLISYEAFYRSWEYIYEVGVRKGYKYSPEIHPGYHPPAENLEYEIRGENMVINYDLEIALPDLRTAYLDPSWIILYDEAGKIINILRTDLRFEKTSRFAGKIHIYGIGGAEIQMPWETPTIDNQWWEPMADLSEADWGRISRIRVFNELADFNFCYKDLQSQHG